MPKQITLALVITKPAHLWSGLQSLLRTIPQIEIIAEAHDPSVLMKISTEMNPNLILLDASILDDTAWTAVSKIKAERPRTKFIALLENVQQQQSAQLAGVDTLLPKGFPAAQLVNLIENSLIQNSQDETNL